MSLAALKARLEANDKAAQVRSWDSSDERVRKGTHRQGPQKPIQWDTAERISWRHKLPAELVPLDKALANARRVLVVYSGVEAFAMFYNLDAGVTNVQKWADAWIEASEYNTRRRAEQTLDMTVETRQVLIALSTATDPTVGVMAFAPNPDWGQAPRIVH